MLRLPARFAAVILCFAPLFRQLTWRHAQVLLVGAILVPGQRTVTGILRISGLCWERRFVNYHLYPPGCLVAQSDRLARRADLPGATINYPCREHQRWTCAPTVWPRRRPSRKSRPRAPVQGPADRRGGSCDTAGQEP